jgi:hypothetical protein
MDSQRQWVTPFNALVAGLTLIFVASVVMGLWHF